MKKNNFRSLQNIFCTLQFLIKETTTKSLKKFIPQSDQNLKQN